LKPVVYGLREVSGGEKPRLGNKIGAAATSGFKLTVDRTAGYELAAERFSVYVPSSYADDTPHGLLVFIAAEPEPSIPASWFEIFEQRGLIWIAPFGADNKQPASRRIGLALEARKHAMLNYNIDPKRMYISGVSGGGIVCSSIIARFPETFNGSIHIVGAGGFGVGNRDYEPGMISPETESSRYVSGLYTSGRYNLISDRVIRRLRWKNRFVLISGKNDFLYREVAEAYLTMGYLGFQAMFLDIPELGHHIPPEVGPIVKALDYLDREYKN
jgi:hypothetical protein